MHALSNRVTVRQSVSSYIRSQPHYLLQVCTPCQVYPDVYPARRVTLPYVSNLHTPDTLKNKTNESKSILNIKKVDV